MSGAPPPSRARGAAVLPCSNEKVRVTIAVGVAAIGGPDAEAFARDGAGQREEALAPIPVDAAFFNDARFTALSAPLPAPTTEPVGKENPFMPLKAQSIAQ